MVRYWRELHFHVVKEDNRNNLMISNVTDVAVVIMFGVRLIFAFFYFKETYDQYYPLKNQSSNHSNLTFFCSNVSDISRLIQNQETHTMLHII